MIATNKSSNAWKVDIDIDVGNASPVRVYHRLSHTVDYVSLFADGVEDTLERSLIASGLLPSWHPAHKRTCLDNSVKRVSLRTSVGVEVNVTAILTHSEATRSERQRDQKKIVMKSCIKNKIFAHIILEASVCMTSTNWASLLSKRTFGSVFWK